MSTPPAQNSLEDSMKEHLLNRAMKGEWQEVSEIYKKHPAAHTAQITGSGDTALHMAISDERANDVEKLVSIVVGKTPHEQEERVVCEGDHVEAKAPEALKIKDVHGSTPLHLAAYVGNARMCHCIAETDSTLIGIRNKYDHTPLFLAVLHGRKEAFLRMHDLCEDDEKRKEYCWRGTDEESILHSAISRDHFDLAFEIMHLYKDLMHSKNKYGITPMHILASKPDAFRSGYSMGFVHTLIYQCVPVKNLKHSDNAKSSQTPSGFIPRLRNITMHHSVPKRDAEDPNGRQHVHEQGSNLRNGKRFGSRPSWRSTLGLLSLGLTTEFRKIREEKQKHTWSVQIMGILLENYGYNYGGGPHSSAPNKDEENTSSALTESKHKEEQKNKEEQKQATSTEVNKDKAMPNEKKGSPLLLSATHGIIEMVKGILETFPAAVHDENADGKNIILLAVENRQSHIYNHLLKWEILKETIFYKTDKEGNGALHLAAKLDKSRNWVITGPALRMQWEIKWYNFVESSMPPKFFAQYNDVMKTPWEIFRETHQEVVVKAGEWLTSTSQSCSVVATLIATVAFTASAAIPGGVKSDTGAPVLEKEAAFSIFALSTLVALCFSISSVVMFLVFFTSRYGEQDFGTKLPMKFLAELTSLLIAIAAVLISFCAGHFLLIKDSFKNTAFCLYAATLFPVALYAVWQTPVYFQLLKATLKKKPEKLPLYFN